MAGNIKGIIVEIGGDTSGLQKALSKVNSATASLSKELRGINSLLKLDPKNTELLAQKQTVLRERIEQTKLTIDKLKEAQRRYIESGGDLNSAEYRNLQREIIKTENDLKQLNLEASKWTQASQNLGELSSKMKSLGNTVSDVGKKVSVLSASIGALFVSGTKYNADIERYTTAFKTFLGSAEEAEKAVNAIKKEGETSPFDTKELIRANQMLITSSVNADEARGVISALADAIALTGGGNDELNRMSYNLKQIKDQTKGTSMDIKQFAMAGIDIYGMLSDYLGKSVKELKEMDITYEDISQALLKATSEGGKYYNGQAEMANTLSGQISKLKKSFQDLLGELSKSLFPVIKKITEKIQGIVEWFRNLDENQKQTITKIGLLIVALGPLIIIIGKIISLIGIVSGILSKLLLFVAKTQLGMTGLSTVLAALTGPVGIVIAVVTALVGAFVHLYKTNEDFRNKANETWQNIVNLFNNSVMPVINNIKDFITDIIKTIINVLKKMWEYIEPLFNTMLTWLMDFWNNTLSDIVANVMSFVNELINAVKWIWNKVISPIVNFLVDILGPVFQKVFNSIWKYVSGAFDMIGNAVKMITGVFSGIIEFISGVFSGNWEKAWNGIVKVFKSIVSGIANIFKTPLNWIIDGINKFIGGINKIKIPDWVPAVGGKGINIPLIPKLAKGGIVNDATLAMIGEGKSAEAVIPLDRTLTKYMAEAMKQAGGSRPITVNFYPQKMTDAEMDNAFNYINKRFGLAY